MPVIPKVIHYCWFGAGEMSDLVKMCMRSWYKYLPNYRLMLWNEESFDINSNLFVKEAHLEKKYAFVSDYVRLYALYNFGGIYLDTDVEVIKNLDRFLIHPAFTGFEDTHWISTSTIGSVKEHPWIGRLLEYYSNRSFFTENGDPDLTTNVKIFSKLSHDEYGWEPGNHFQILRDNVYIYPNDYFSPKDSETKDIDISDNTHTIHHFLGSWL